jgi:hypothetical protein
VIIHNFFLGGCCRGAGVRLLLQRASSLQLSLPLQHLERLLIASFGVDLTVGHAFDKVLDRIHLQGLVRRIAKQLSIGHFIWLQMNGGVGEIPAP